MRYQIKKGAESRTFANCRRISINVVESDEPLNSIYLEPIREQTQMTAAPNAPVSPSNPPQTTPVGTPESPGLSPSNPPENQNKEAN